MNEAITQLQEWFRAQCNGEWENDHGVVIETTDNPGWWVKINLSGTQLRNRAFAPVKRGDLTLDPRPPWLHCFVEDEIFNGAGDPDALGEILNIFLRWAEGERKKGSDDPDRLARGDVDPKVSR